ncbi:MAG: hypothetical protein IAI49_14940, partial [Candidatus Eremiobacteraeota bacterium]|nr:hypothetical protein [Candidatus Eremiobacteraeota bacterium]
MHAPIRTAAAAIATLLVSNARFAEPSASLAATPPAMQTIDSTGGGQILAGTLGDGLSLDGATHAMLARIHRAFGTRPTIVQ